MTGPFAFEAICLVGILLAMVIILTVIGYIIWTEDGKP